jgi:hypothetical protein
LFFSVIAPSNKQNRKRKRDSENDPSSTETNRKTSKKSVTTNGQVCDFLRVLSSINKTDHNDLTEILLKVMLNTINQAKYQRASMTISKHFYQNKNNSTVP